MVKRRLGRGFYLLVVFAIAALFVYTIVPGDDAGYNATFDYECRTNGSKPDPDIIHYCIRGKQIFFVETSESRRLTVRQACAVESTAQHNPWTSVTALMTPPQGVDHSHELTKILTALPNAALVHIDLEIFVHGTPVWRWLRSGKWRYSEWKVSHLSDALRFLIAWKYGGMYLDLDIVTMRSLKPFKNAVITENWESVASGMLIFEPHHELMRRCMEDLVRNYKPHNFGANGPGLMTRNLKKFCDVSEVGKVSGSSCDANVLPPETAFPIPWDRWEEYLKPVSLNTTVASHFPSSSMIHVWNKYSRDGKLVIGENSLYERAMKEHCPRVYKYAKQFKDV